MTVIRSNPHSGRPAAGFTLIEMLIAITILAVGMLAVASMQVAALQTNGKAARYTEASNLAQDRLERLLSLPYNDPGLAGGTDTTEVVDHLTVNWTVTDVDLSLDGNDDAKRIIVRASFQDALGTGASITRNVTFQYVRPQAF